MTIELSADERNRLLGGPLAAALAVMTVDLGIFSGAAQRYPDNPLIASLFDEQALRQGIHPEKLQVSGEDVRNGRVLDRALAEVDEAMTLARGKTDEATVQQYAELILDGCVAVAEAAGKGLFGTGEKVSAEEKAALERIRTHLGLSPAAV